MKSRVRKYTQKDMYMLCDEVQDVIDDVINANGAIYIVTLARMGWGKKRLREDRRKKKPVSVVEAARMQKQLMNMKGYLENDERADDKA